MQKHIRLLRLLVEFVEHISRADDRTAVYHGSHLGIQTAVHALRTRERDNRAAVYRHIAVGIHTVALGADRVAVYISAVDCDMRYVVLAAVYRIVLTLDVDRSAVYRKMLIFYLDPLHISNDA